MQSNDQAIANLERDMKDIEYTLSVCVDDIERNELEEQLETLIKKLKSLKRKSADKSLNRNTIKNMGWGRY